VDATPGSTSGHTSPPAAAPAATAGTPGRLVFTSEDYSNADFFSTPSAAAAGPLLAMSALSGPAAASPLMQLAAMASSSSVHDAAASPLDSALLHLAGAALQYLETELSQASTFDASTAAAAAAAGMASCLPSLSGIEYVGSIDDGAWGGEEAEQQQQQQVTSSGADWGYDDDGLPVYQQQQQVSVTATATAAAEAEPASPHLQQRCSFAAADADMEVAAQGAELSAQVEGDGRASPALFATPTATPVGASRTRHATGGVAALLLGPAGDAAEPQGQQERQQAHKQQYTAAEVPLSFLPSNDNTAEGSAAPHVTVGDAAAAFMSFDGSSRTAAAWAGATPALAAEGSSSILPSLLQRWLSRTAEESDAETDSMDAAEVVQGPGLHARAAEVHTAADADAAAAAVPTNASWSSPSASTSSSVVEAEQQLQQQQQEEAGTAFVHAGEALPTCNSSQALQGSLGTAANTDDGTAADGQCSQLGLPAAALALVAAGGDAAAEQQLLESPSTGVLAAAAEAENRLVRCLLLEEAELCTVSTPAADTAAVEAAQRAVLSQVTHAAGGPEADVQQSVLLAAESIGEQAAASVAATVYNSIVEEDWWVNLQVAGAQQQFCLLYSMLLLRSACCTTIVRFATHHCAGSSADMLYLSGIMVCR
jgi:hypothetical protein